MAKAIDGRISFSNAPLVSVFYFCDLGKSFNLLDSVLSFIRGCGPYIFAYSSWGCSEKLLS